MRFQMTCKVRLKTHPAVPLELRDTVTSVDADGAYKAMKERHDYRYDFLEVMRQVEVR